MNVLPKPATVDGLTSIVIPCFNQLRYTKHCIRNVLAHTRPAYELVLIDNGSTDETAEFMAGLRKHREPVAVRIVRNDRNLGFPAACNQGIEASRGGVVLLLNNDTVVTPGWLEGLLARLAPNHRNIGLAGPVSNGAPPPQFVATDFVDHPGLMAFAARRGRECRGRTMLVTRLIGFCLAIRRDVIDRIGTLDERYGLGFFDDDDLCFRAADAGFRLAVAEDVYVHHFGSCTFKSLGTDPRELLRANFAIFRDKWGEGRVAGYREMEPPSLPPSSNPGSGAQ